MPDAAELPAWALYTVAFGTPASAFAGVMVTGWLNRRGATELEHRSRREEVMRQLRWSSELAVSSDERQARLGVDLLSVLAESELLGPAEGLLVDAALESALGTAVDVIEESRCGGEDVDVMGEMPDGRPAADVKSWGLTDGGADG